jgi:hypothetical protein
MPRQLSPLLLHASACAPLMRCCCPCSTLCPGVTAGQNVTGVSSLCCDCALPHHCKPLTRIQRALVVVRPLPRSPRCLHRCRAPRSPHLRCCFQGCALRHRGRHAAAHCHSSGTLHRHYCRTCGAQRALALLCIFYDALQVRHREAAHVVKKTKVSLLPLLPHANENQLGQLAQVRGIEASCQHRMSR